MKSIYLAVALATSAFVAFAQTQIPQPILGQRGLQVGAAYASDQAESANVVNGNLTYTIPLATLPPNPSGIATPVSLVYNSQLWDVVLSLQYDSNCNLQTQYYPTPALSGGWQYSYGYGIDQVGIPSIGGSSGCAPCNPYAYLTRVTFPDGSTHILTPLSYASEGTVNGNNGYFRIDVSNWQVRAPGSCSPASLSGDQTFYTTDGTFTRVVFLDGNQTWANRAWKIYRPDGAIITGVGSSMQSITDRNGNVTSVVRYYSQNGAYIYLSNGVNSGITINPQWYPGNNSRTDTITYSSVAPGGTSATEVFHWTAIWGLLPMGSAPGYSLYAYETPNSSTQTLINTQKNELTSLALSGAGISMSYSLSYNPGWGEMTSITTPSGAQRQYTYTYTASDIRDFRTNVSNPVTQKTVTRTDSEPVESWSYNYFGTRTEITGPQGTYKYYYRDPQNSTDWARGLVYKAIDPSLDQTERVWGRNKPWQAYNASPGNPYVEAEIRTSGSKTHVTEFRYDRNGNPTQTNVLDWQGTASAAIQHDASGGPTTYSGGTLLSSAVSAIKSPAAAAATVSHGSVDINESVPQGSAEYWNASSAPILGLVDSTQVKQGGTVFAAAEFSYDSNGNRTSSKLWDSTKQGSYVYGQSRSTASVTDTAYNNGGAVQSVTDPNGNVTTYDYSLNRCGTYMYPNRIDNGLKRDFVYDCRFGLPSQITDFDNSLASTFTYDPLGRTTFSSEANGARSTTITFDDANRKVTTATTRDVGSNVTTVIHFDDQGREVTRQETDDDGTTGVQTDSRYMYSGQWMYRIRSNPYRPAAPSSTGWNTPSGWTRWTTNIAGRQSWTESFSGSSMPTPFGSSGTGMGAITTVVAADTTTVTEPANGSASNPSRTVVMDALGRVTSADDAVSSAVYTYNPRGLTSVTQGTQVRGFGYTSLSRLFSATNPESGTIQYTYDANGNLKTRTDARAITATMNYDSLDRITSKTYSDSNSTNPTPWVSYVYDSGCLKGYLCQVYAGGVAQNFFYNALGQTTFSAQYFGANPYNFAYTYDLLGNRKSITYPSGRVVNFSLSAAGRAQSVTGVTPDRLPFNYTSAPLIYAPHGALSLVTWANSVQENYTFDPRLSWQGMTVLRANPSAGANATYTPLSINNGFAANGNITSQQVSQQAAGSSPATVTFTQSYGYDAANRLTGTTELNGASQIWSETYSMDQYGNRAVSSGLAMNVATPTALSQFNSANNRITSQPNNSAMPSNAYDAAGNLTNHPQLGQLVYDAENRLLSAVTPMGSATYAYDGMGRRVSKTTSARTTYYIYDAEGQLAAEYGPATGGGGTQFITSDQVGSTRLVTGGIGTLPVRHDYHPFGEDLAPTDNSAVRNTYEYSLPDSVKQKFTGAERDTETGLDNLIARYYSPAQGRFTSPDSPLTAQDPTDPQSWNLYSYGLNNPLLYLDPNGEEPCVNGQNPENGNICAVGTAQAPSDIAGLLLDYWNFSLRAAQLLGQIQQAVSPALTAIDSFRSSRNCAATLTVGGAVVGGGVGAYLGGGAGGTAGFFGGSAVPVAGNVAGLVGGVSLGATGGGLAGASIGSAVGALASGIICNSSAGSGGGSGDSGAAGKWKLGAHKSAEKWAGQMAKRGWTPQQIDEALEKGQRFAAPNNVNPANGATRYVHPTTGRSIVLDDVTGELIHVGGNGFRY